MDYIRHAYETGLRRGQDLTARGAPLEGAVGWSFSHVDKYSADQTAWARARFAEEQKWRRGRGVDVAHMLRRLRQGPAVMAGVDFQRYFPHGPEDGEKTGTPGNIFVATGLTNLISLWTGLASAAAIHPLTQTGYTPVVGVGTGTTAPATSDITLISNNGSAWFQGFDASTLGTTTTNGQMIGTCTFASANANFAWNEWCWATGSGVVTAGSIGTSTAAEPFAGGNFQMVNHKTAVNLGSKASGSSWVFSTTFTIS